MSELEARIRNLEHRQEIIELGHRYCTYLDRRSWKTFLDLFTEEAVISYPDEERESFQGHEGIESFTDGVEQGRGFMAHMRHNPIIEIDGETAEGSWNYEAAFTDTAGTPSLAQGEYQEEYQLVEGEWKFSLIEIRHNFVVESETDWSTVVDP